MWARCGLAFLLCAVCASVEWTKATNNFVVDVHQNYNEIVNLRLQQLVNSYNEAELFYKAYASYFARADIGLNGFSKYMSAHSEHMRNQVLSLTEYINLRGGFIRFTPVKLAAVCGEVRKQLVKLDTKPKRTNADICQFQREKKKRSKSKEVQIGAYTGLYGLEDALAIEKSLIELLDGPIGAIKTAIDHGDGHAKHVLELYLEKERVKLLKDKIERLRKYGDEEYHLGEYTLDQELMA